MMRRSIRKESATLASMACLFAFAGPLAAEPDASLRLKVKVMEKAPPAQRHGAAIAYDSKRHHTLVLGGASLGSKKPINDVLCFDSTNSTWSKYESKGDAPQVGIFAAMAYAESEDTVFAFGGWARGSDKPSSELWMLNQRTKRPPSWEKIDAKGDPPARNGLVMAYDGGGNRLLVHGGDGGPSGDVGFTPLDDLWSFDLAKKEWKQIDPNGDMPSPRWAHSGAFDAKARKWYLFGGGGGSAGFNDVHVFDAAGGRWKLLHTKGDAPPPTEATSLTFDPEAGALLVVGGLSIADQGPAGFKDAWTLDLKSMQWTRHRDVLKTTRRDHVAVYDSNLKRHIVYGGMTCTVLGNFYERGEPVTDSLVMEVTRPAASEQTREHNSQ